MTQRDTELDWIKARSLYVAVWLLPSSDGRSSPWRMWRFCKRLVCSERCSAPAKHCYLWATTLHPSWTQEGRHCQSETKYGSNLTNCGKLHIMADTSCITKTQMLTTALLHSFTCLWPGLVYFWSVELHTTHQPTQSTWPPQVIQTILPASSRWVPLSAQDFFLFFFATVAVVLGLGVSGQVL